MWDIETFIVPPLTLLMPDAAETILDYRIRNLPAARRNAALNGRRGALYPWESCPLHGEEVTPGARPPMQEHASLVVALALAGHIHATGDLEYAHRAWPVLRSVAEFVESRVVRRGGRYHWLATVGPREVYEPVDDDAFLNMAASRALDEAVICSRAIGLVPPRSWREIAVRLAIPVARGGWIRNHRRGMLRERQGGAPEAAAGLFPIGYEPDPAVERATYEYAVRAQAPRFVGMPMFSALMPAFASRLGDRRAARRLLERGYGAFAQPPYSEIDEFPISQDRPRASPMFANMGGYLLGLLYGYPNLRLGGPSIDGWIQAPASLPAGWRGIHAGRIWAHRSGYVMDVEHGRSASMTSAP